MQALSQALLDMKVGGVQAALEGRKATRAERNLTVRDLGRRNDPNFDRNIEQQIAAAKPKLEQSMRALNERSRRSPRISRCAEVDRAGNREHARPQLSAPMKSFEEPKATRNSIRALDCVAPLAMTVD